MSAAEVGGLLATAVAAGDVPGAVAAAGDSDGCRSRWVEGWADTTPGCRWPITADTRFDLASLTKVVATTTVVLGLVADGRVRLDQPAARWLPGVGGQHAEAVTVERLLTHTSGLPATTELWTAGIPPDEARLALRRTPLAAAPGSRVAYSDVGFLLLGQLVEAELGAPLDAAFAQRVAAPLDLADTGYGPLPDGADVAATERREDGTPWAGMVHDENARFLGGVAGHAGLFSTAADLARYVDWWVGDDDEPVPARLRRAAEACRTDNLGGRRGLGWVCRGDSHDTLEGWPDGAVSHTGFTGTSIALDPASRRWVVLLTNAVHLGRRPDPIRRLRRAVAAALAPGAA